MLFLPSFQALLPEARDTWECQARNRDLYCAPARSGPFLWTLKPLQKHLHPGCLMPLSSTVVTKQREKVCFFGHPNNLHCQGCVSCCWKRGYQNLETNLLHVNKGLFIGKFLAKSAALLSVIQNLMRRQDSGLCRRDRSLMQACQPLWSQEAVIISIWDVSQPLSVF